MEIAGHVCEANQEANAQRQEMSIAISNALALISWHDFGSFLGNFTGGSAVWLLLGFLLAIVALSALATEAALVVHTAHRPQFRARRPADLSESTIPESSGEAGPVGSGTRT